MKKFNHFLACSVMLSSLFLYSCRKQISEPAANEATVALQVMPETSCKPAVFGVFDESRSGSHWTTIAQKWYSGGKVAYFKGNFSGASPGLAGYIGVEPMFNVDWGKVTYDGNQVRLHDVGKNRLIFRVTMEGAKPVASYMYNQTDNAENAMMNDTTYYYYSGNRLDYMIRFAEIRLYGPNTSRAWEKFTFEYDAWGNVSAINFVANKARMIFKYDYSKPVSGMVSNYILTSSARLLEFLELLKIPMHHALTEATLGFVSSNGSFSPVFQNKYDNYVINDGLVHSYQSQPGLNHKQTFYNGWECGGSPAQEATNRQKNIISSLEQFRQLYPAPVK